jgi:hypothetical protein
MKKIVGSLLLLAIVLTIVFPVIALASSSTPMTAKEMSSLTGGMLPGVCQTVGKTTQQVCEFIGVEWLTCTLGGLAAYFVCAFIF